ncbi:hypothetical protein [Rhizobacter fulvus]
MNRMHETFMQCLHSGALIEARHFREYLQVSEEEIEHQLLTRRLFAIDWAGTRAFPAFFLNPLYRRAELEAVSQALGQLSGGSKWLFYTSSRGSLAILRGEDVHERSPLETLLDGDFQRVLRVAHGHAET